MRERRRPQQHGVDDAEYGGVEADADRQRQDHHGGESTAPAQHAQRVADVLPQLVDPDGNPDRPRVLLRARDAAECFERRGPGVLRRQPAVDVLLDGALEMIADVVVQRVEVTAALHAGRSTRVMARASVSHFVVSTSS